MWYFLRTFIETTATGSKSVNSHGNIREKDFPDLADTLHTIHRMYFDTQRGAFLPSNGMTLRVFQGLLP